VSVEQAISAPLATRHLADLGAEVLKIESPSGDFARAYDGKMNGLSVHFVWANRGKRSIILDLKDPADRSRLDGFIAGCDVFVQNLSTRAARSLRIDAERLILNHPSLIAVDICGYGHGGSQENDKAYDLAIQAEAGAFSVTGDSEMSKVGFPVADISAAMYATMSILAALVGRQATGRGTAVCVSMLDCLTEWLSAPMYAAVYGGGQPPRSGRRHHGIAPYGTFPLQDASVVLIAVQNDTEWRAFVAEFWDDAHDVFGADFATNAQRIERVEALESLIRKRFATLAPSEVRAGLDRANVARAVVRDLADVWNHPQLRERERFMNVQSSVGPLEMLKPPFDFSGWQIRTGSVPDLGQMNPPEDRT